MSIIEDAIQKYGGADEAYKNKLKENIRNAMGYSNYVAKSQNAANSGLNLNLKGNITPQGVRSLVGGAINQKQNEVETYADLAGAIDTAAGTLASKQASGRGKGNDSRYDTSFIYDPGGDELDQKILDYAQNPYNDDGTVKSLQQFEQELRDQYAAQSTEGTQSDLLADFPGEQARTIPGKYTPEDIKNKLLERLPDDYIGNEEMYSYRFRGFGEQEATDEMLLNYGDMIVSGRGKDVPPELYPAAYATLTPSERSKIYQGVAGAGGARDTGF